MKLFLIIIFATIVFYKGQLLAFKFLREPFYKFMAQVNSLLAQIHDALKAFLLTRALTRNYPYSTVETRRKMYKEEDDVFLKELPRHLFKRFDGMSDSNVDDGRIEYYRPKSYIIKYVKSHGYKAENHFVHTEDGYILTIHRILRPKRSDTSYKKRIVILNHGLLGSSIDWLVLGPNKSLPYMLLDSGCEVWLMNARGNVFSRLHKNRLTTSNSFWSFSWQEMGAYDVPAVIDYIIQHEKTNQSIYYIGHSMGATSLLVTLSTIPKYNKLLKMGILLAPLAIMNNVKGSLKMLSESSIEERYSIISSPQSEEVKVRLNNNVASKMCKLYCTSPLFYLAGPPKNDHDWSPEFKLKILYSAFGGGSVNTILHYSSLVWTRKFNEYLDESSQYRLSKITLPLAVMSSTDDNLATVPDVTTLFDTIAYPLEHHIVNKNISHTEFVWGSHANKIIFKKVIRFIDNS